MQDCWRKTVGAKAAQFHLLFKACCNILFELFCHMQFQFWIGQFLMQMQCTVVCFYLSLVWWNEPWIGFYRLNVSMVLFTHVFSTCVNRKWQLSRWRHLLTISYLNEVAVNDVVADRGSVQVNFSVWGRQVAVEVDPDSTKGPQVVEGAARLELAKHHFKICLKEKFLNSDFWGQFHQHFTCSFCARRITPILLVHGVGWKA